jgi:hypothetical protein
MQRSEEPFDPHQVQMNAHIVLAETFYGVPVGRLPDGQQPIEILLDHDIAEIHRNGPYEIEFLVAPQLMGDVSDSIFKGVVSANLVAGPAIAPVNGIEIPGNGMSVIAKGTHHNMGLHRPVPGADLVENPPEMLHQTP